MKPPSVQSDLFAALPDYQQQHGKRVIGGYRPTLPPKNIEVLPGIVQGSWPSGVVLAAVDDASALRFESLVDVADLERMRRTGARYLIVHRNPAQEVRGTVPSKRSSISLDFAKGLGPAIYEDAWLTVFDLAP